ncbi:hypothetical protein [Micromonospora sp. b486]|uniref:hypothetical protein n=1 Tax=Micromonospora sp. b486 TaxID=3053986 RepID=UPI00259CF151|nr:hypothetical protein [Micromonospora sp. b486]MDM4784485.1 hypothetical protein [Micromonospora sp. b486]
MPHPRPIRGDAPHHAAGRPRDGAAAGVLTAETEDQCPTTTSRPRAARPRPPIAPTPLSATDLPTLRRPADPPRKPTDNRPTGVVAGWITRGGSGPCYGLMDENGTEYAVYGPNAGEMRKGELVTLRLTARDRSVDCGPGIPMRIIEE